jgi:hypothetical protein
MTGSGDASISEAFLVQLAQYRRLTPHHPLRSGERFVHTAARRVTSEDVPFREVIT